MVIDTNVLYSGLYSASGASFQILCLVEERQLTPVLSTALLFEYEEVLTRNHDALGLTPLDIEDVLDGLCRRGDNRKIHFLWRPQLATSRMTMCWSWLFQVVAWISSRTMSRILVLHPISEFGCFPRANF